MLLFVEVIQTFCAIFSLIKEIKVLKNIISKYSMLYKCVNVKESRIDGLK